MRAFTYYKTVIESHPWLPYVAPFAAFLILTTLEGQVFPAPTAEKGALAIAAYRHAYPFVYLVKILLVSLVAILCGGSWNDLKPVPGVVSLAAAVVLGVVVAALWVGLDALYPRFGFLGQRTAFDPTALPQGVRLTYLATRFFGLVLVVPLIEELFWRSFLMRWLIDPDFKKVPIGKVTWMAAGVTSVLFALEHPEWLPALITGLAWAGLLAWSRSVSACWISHLVANAALGAYVVTTHRWEFL
jgi:CAAX prenyl protease-like protein